MHDDAPHIRFLEQAVLLAVESASSGGGPFGAIITRGDEVIARAANRVTLDHDPTAHAEVLAIRRACADLDTHNLSGCTLYASCEPCPMCLGAILWSRVDDLYFAADRHDAAQAGFDDARFHHTLAGFGDALPAHHFPIAVRCAPFDAWSRNPGRVPY